MVSAVEDNVKIFSDWMAFMQYVTDRLKPKEATHDQPPSKNNRPSEIWISELQVYFEFRGHPEAILDLSMNSKFMIGFALVGETSLMYNGMPLKDAERYGFLDPPSAPSEGFVKWLEDVKRAEPGGDPKFAGKYPQSYIKFVADIPVYNGLVFLENATVHQDMWVIPDTGRLKTAANEYELELELLRARLRIMDTINYRLENAKIPLGDVKVRLAAVNVPQDVDDITDEEWGEIMRHKSDMAYLYFVMRKIGKAGWAKLTVKLKESMAKQK